MFRGRKDIPLNETGKMQAETTAAFFRNKEIKAIFSSPLSRAFEMARIIGSGVGAPVQTKEEFNDMAFGKWEGLSLAEVEKSYPRELLIWRHWPQKFRITGAENLTRVRKRLIVGLREILDSDYSNVVIVSHRVICKIMILHLLGIANEHFWKMKCDPAAITLIGREGDEVSLYFMNETCHLKDDGRVCRDL